MTQQPTYNLHLPDGGKIQAIQEEGLSPDDLFSHPR